MAYESRSGTKRRYFYQSIWRDGRSKKIYHGRGALAAMQFESMTEDRNERAAVRDQCRYWRARYRELRAMDEESKSQIAAIEASGATDPPTGIVDHELRELLARCQPARPLPEELLSRLQTHPEEWASIGSLAERNIGRMIREIAGKNNEQMRLILATTVDSQRDRLGAAAATPLQQLLIDRVIVNDMLQSYFENRLLVADQSRQPALIRVLKEIVTSCHRQSLAAMRALDKVSRRRRSGDRRAKPRDESPAGSPQAIEAAGPQPTSPG